MTKILVLGSSGQVGSELHKLSSLYPQYNFTFADRGILNLNNLHDISEYFSNKTFDTIVNCAAYTAVDKAESDREMADTINHRAVEIIAKIAKIKNISLIHISTDYVFNGKNFQAYVETDPTDPINFYGKTKHLGEEAILNIAPSRAIIIRTSWVYSSFGNNFVKTMLRLGNERESLKIIFDQVGTPTFAKDLAQLILNIIPKIKNEGPAIYHYSNEGVASWYDFAKEIFDISKLNCKVSPITTLEYPTPAARPYFSLLNKNKIKKEFEIEIPYWKNSLAECLTLLNKND